MKAVLLGRGFRPIFFDERMDLLERFEALFPDVAYAYLTADREFIGKEWLSYLLMDKPIPKRNSYTSK